MKTKFLKTYDLIMEQIFKDKNFEFEDMTLAIVPGSFKPPHKAHWEMVMKYIDTADKVIVLISNISSTAISSRPLSLTNLKDLGKIKAYADSKLNDNEELLAILDDLTSDAESISFQTLSKSMTDILTLNLNDNKFNTMIQKYLIRLNKSLFRSIRKTANNIEITPEMSKEIFEIFIKAYNVQDKVDIRISNEASPITATYGLANDSCKNCKILLGVLKKGGDEARWNDLKQSEENPTNKLVASPVEVQTMLSATQLQNGINDLQRSWFPDNITDEDFEKIKEILTK